jgi:hypothetical protein
MLKDTACEKCAFVEMGACERVDQCPNFIETKWLDKDNNTIILKDCAPKRMLLQHQAEVNTTLDLQKNIDRLKTEVYLLNENVEKLTENLNMCIRHVNNTVENIKNREVNRVTHS